jgi:hypothetical protein
MDECASGGKDDDAMRDRTVSRRRCRQPTLDVLETRGLLSGLGGVGQPTLLLTETPARAPGHVAVDTTAEKSSSNASDPADPAPDVDESSSIESDNRKVLASGESPDPATREDVLVGASKDDAEEALQTGYQSGSTPATSGAVAPSSSLNATDLHSSTVGSGIAQSVSFSRDGDATSGQLGRLANSPPTGPSAATGVASSGAKWDKGKSSGRAGANEPDEIGMGPAIIAQEGAHGEAPLPSPQGDGLISHLPQFDRSAIEAAFDHWFAQIEKHGAIVGSYQPNPTQLLAFSLGAAAVIAGISLSRRVRLGEEEQAVGGRGAGRRGSFLEFPLAWSPRFP